MRWSTQTSPGGSRRGLLLDVDADPAGPARPPLRVEVAAGRRLAIVQGARPVLLARVAAYDHGVAFRRTPEPYRSPVGPLASPAGGLASPVRPLASSGGPPAGDPPSGA
ncbi:hypothetical protein HII36_35170, partial [Nonomuraea sp. NN258]|nr:hypothetical protein [Nonomuraea antri]